jgi:hypothetical protein
MQVRLSPWQIVTLVTLCVAVVAISAVALVLGKEAIISIAVILFFFVALGGLVPDLAAGLPFGRALATHRAAA